MIRIARVAQERWGSPMSDKGTHVAGARWKSVKASIVIGAFAEHAAPVDKVMHTGQHYGPNGSELFAGDCQSPAK
jgi:hypothetical protein